MLTYDLDRRGKLARYDYLYRCIREDILAVRLTARWLKKRKEAHDDL